MRRYFFGLALGITLLVPGMTHASAAAFARADFAGEDLGSIDHRRVRSRAQRHPLRSQGGAVENRAH